MKTYRLEEIVKISSSKRIKMNEYVSSGIPFFRSKEIINLHRNQKIQTELFISEERFNEIDEKFGSPSPGDILLTSVGTLGIPYQVKAGDKFYFKDGNLTWFKNYSENVNQKYLYYWLTSQTAKRKFDEITIGSTQKALTIISLKGIEIDLPSLNVQDDVVAVIDSIQTKIELNQKMNETLEEIAKTLFKSWFIDFDPVRAKAEGRSTGLSKEISDLFPDSFEDSELGEIPKGWTTDSISEIVNIEYGKILPTKKLLDEGFPVFGGNGVIGYFNEYLYEDVMTVIACRGAASGKVLRTLPKSFVTNNSLVLNHSQTNFCYQTYVDLYLRSIDLSIFVTGSAQPQLTIDNLSHLKMIIPSLEILELFQDQAGLLFQKIILNDDSSTNLKNLRDTLLPKLISGEIRIPDAEAVLEEADA